MENTSLAMLLAQQYPPVARRFPRRLGLVAGDDLELAAAQAGGDLEPVEAVDVALCLAQRLGQSRLGQPEHPHDVLAVDGPAGDRLLHGRCPTAVCHIG